MVGLHGARHRSLRCGRGSSEHARDDLPGKAARYGEHDRDPSKAGREGLLPAEHFVDADYVDLDLPVASQGAHAVSLEGPVRAMPTRSKEAEQADEQRHFAIEWVSERVICPKGKCPPTAPQRQIEALRERRMAVSLRIRRLDAQDRT